ncbi:peptide ABC transporter substrate-binding protein [Paenibacillus sp. MMO-58]|uniref:peptide ABC transporter substrate-binding protein n=1 Tax=Paenibacillus sp. MMO-58 TaxID=3081290 RepID=UPI0030175AE2
MKKKLAALLSILLMISFIVVTGSSAFAVGGKQVLRMASAYVTDELDPASAQDTSTFTLLGGLFEGLVRLDETGQAVPAIAKWWKVSNNGLTYTFTLRSNAKWSNNQLVKATDFEYSWKRALAPAAQNTYAYNMYPISNAKAYNTGKLKDVSKVGVKALNATTLQVTLVEPIAYFPQLLAEPIFAPVPASVVKANKDWASNAATVVSNGPFKIKQWQKGKLVLVKNPSYYDADKIRLTEVQVIQPTWQTSSTAAYVKGNLDWVGGGEEIYFEELNDKAYKDYRVVPQASTYYYQFNVNKAPFNNLKIRKALAMAVDRKAINYGTPAYGFVPNGIHGVKNEFRFEFADNYFTEDTNKAKLLLQEGLKEEGLTELPRFTVITNAGSHEQIADQIVSTWEERLGVKVDIDVQEWAELLRNRSQNNFQVARAGWGADYNDPASFLEYFTSWSSSNDSGWNNSAYDQYMKQAQRQTNAQLRNQLYAKAEKLLIDQMVILPIYYYKMDILQKRNLKGMHVKYEGTVDFSRAYFE